MKRFIAALLLLAACACVARADLITRSLNASLDTGSLAGTKFPVSFSYDSAGISAVGDTYVELNSFAFTLLGVQFTKSDIYQGGQVIFHDGVIQNVTASILLRTSNPPLNNITFGFGGDGVIGYIDRTGQFGLGSFTFAPPSAPIISARGIVDGASFKGSPGGGSIVSLFGTGLAMASVSASTLPLPVTLGGTTLTISGHPVPLFYVSPTQINFQYPWGPDFCCPDVDPPLVVTVNGVASNTVLITGATVGSGAAVFTVNSTGTGQGAIQIANTSIFAAPTGSVPGAQSRPAQHGEFLSIYCTNLGMVNNLPPAGTAAPVIPLATTLFIPTVTIGGIPALVTYSGLAPGTVGSYQVNVQVPTGAPTGNAVPVEVTIFVPRVLNPVTIAIQ